MFARCKYKLSLLRLYSSVDTLPQDITVKTPFKALPRAIILTLLSFFLSFDVNVIMMPSTSLDNFRMMTSRFLYNLDRTPAHKKQKIKARARLHVDCVLESSIFLMRGKSAPICYRTVRANDTPPASSRAHFCDCVTSDNDARIRNRGAISPLCILSPSPSLHFNFHCDCARSQSRKVKFQDFKLTRRARSSSLMLSSVWN